MRALNTLLGVRRNIVLLALATLVGTTTETVWAGPNEWTRVGPKGGQILALSIDPHNPGTIYAATDEGHVFKSVNGGASWTTSGAPNSVLIFDPQSPGTMYAVSGYPDRILKSTDNGASWSPASSRLPPYTVSALAIDPGNPSTVYTVSSSGVFKSTDGGMSLNPANSGLPDWSNGLEDCCFRPRLAVTYKIPPGFIWELL